MACLHRGRVFAALKPKVPDRLGRVVSALVNQNVAGNLWGPLARWALKSAWWFKEGAVSDSVMNSIRDDLTSWPGSGSLTARPTGDDAPWQSIEHGSDTAHCGCDSGLDDDRR
jgi:hypothetical protein